MNVHDNQEWDRVTETACVYFEIWQIGCEGKQKPTLENQKLKKADMLVASSSESYR